MKRLTRNEIAVLRKRLVKWQEPREMRDLVRVTMESLGTENLYNQGGLAFIRDAWTAAEFGEIRKAEKVRLADGNWPDFELHIDGQIEAFEAVEADDPNRRRGLEYREEFHLKDDPERDWIIRAERTPEWLRAACERKVGKRYGARASLIIYLNMTEYGVRQSQVESCFSSATEIAKDAFDSVWILWKRKAYRVWPK